VTVAGGGAGGGGRGPRNGSRGKILGRGLKKAGRSCPLEICRPLGKEKELADGAMFVKIPGIFISASGLHYSGPP
jgi:hypothetical protein